jgi:hypothetical protein
MECQGGEEAQGVADQKNCSLTFPYFCQFFITSVNGRRSGESDVRNEIGNALFNRIVRAHK